MQELGVLTFRAVINSSITQMVLPYLGFCMLGLNRPGIMQHCSIYCVYVDPHHSDLCCSEVNCAPICPQFLTQINIHSAVSVSRSLLPTSPLVFSTTSCLQVRASTFTQGTYPSALKIVGQDCQQRGCCPSSVGHVTQAKPIRLFLPGLQLEVVLAEKEKQ